MLRCLHSLDVLSSFLWLGFDTLHQATPLQLCPPYLSLALTSTCWSSPLCGCPPSSSWLWHFTSLPLLEIDPSHSAWALILLTGLRSECVSFSSSLVCDNLLQVNTVWMLSLLFVDYSTPAPTPNPCIDPSSPYWGSEFRCWITPILLQGYPPQILRLLHPCWATPPHGCSSHLVEALLPVLDYPHLLMPSTSLACDIPLGRPSVHLLMSLWFWLCPVSWF